MGFPYEFMSCTGFQVFGSGKGVAECNIAWTLCVVAFMITVFLALILKRQCKDGFLSGTPYNLIGALVLGVAAFYLVTDMFGEARWALAAGVLGVAIGGIGLGYLWNMNDGGGDDGSTAD